MIFDRVATQTDNLLSSVWQYSYYETGQLFQSISPESSVGAGDAQTTTYTYDLLGQPLDVTLPDSSVQSRRYHPDGQLAKTFGFANQPCRIYLRSSGSTTYAQDLAGL